MVLEAKLSDQEGDEALDPTTMDPEKISRRGVIDLVHKVCNSRTDCPNTELVVDEVMRIVEAHKGEGRMRLTIQHLITHVISDVLTGLTH